MIRTRLVALTAVTVLVAAGCSRDADPQPQPANELSVATEFAEGLAQKVTADAMMTHLTRLQEIADAHGGNRALGTPGYDASVDYVVEALRGKGFDVDTPEFEVRIPWAEEPRLTVGGAPTEARPLQFTIGTAPEGVSGPLVAARADDDTPGCTADDYDGLAVDGAVVLVDRGACPFGGKQAVAADLGAVALIVANSENGPDLSGATLGETTDVKIPVIAVANDVGDRLRAEPGATAVLNLNAGVQLKKSRNVIAQTKTGSTHDVVMVGAHLDSVPEGPGINDNGSGVAAVLETALQLEASPNVANAVRFGFWGAEEQGLYGSANYVAGLDEEALKDIALYLNFDMIGSPNPGYFTMDGNQSSAPGPGERVPRVPEGSAGIERTLTAYLDGAGKPGEDTSFDGRSDYDGFTMAGVPAGGLFSGAEEKMSAEQAERWDGQADQPFDPNYHKDSDTLEHIDETAMQIHGSGAAFAVGLYAQDQRGRNGIPLREDRVRHQLKTP
ncbi:M28 family metallopeptidase [Mycobacterium sp. ITM-2016-00317]|uniref:M28 family metallopeptidase n=1 Tax=Mycobacterium sp. ITM-2016-00317 TaxID=2099694 RepID=UPI00287F8D19|nr:M28 family metallopeptidase [Mycobacterium sp. ITM-2016-00317]WNG88259.1 M28 family metallopeptidase [Mycobacterium sp. ITM-2016-00317]